MVAQISIFTNSRPVFGVQAIMAGSDRVVIAQILIRFKLTELIALTWVIVTPIITIGPEGPPYTPRFFNGEGLIVYHIIAFPLFMRPKYDPISVWPNKHKSFVHCSFI